MQSAIQPNSKSLSDATQHTTAQKAQMASALFNDVQLLGSALTCTAEWDDLPCDEQMRLEDNRFSTMMDKGQIRDVSIHVTDYLLDNMPTLLDEDVLEVDGSTRKELGCCKTPSPKH